MVDLRLLGFGLRRQPIAEVARDAFPWLVGSLVVMLVTGIGLFLSEPTKCYYSTPFWIKMSSLLVAIIFTFAVRRPVTQADETRIQPDLVQARGTGVAGVVVHQAQSWRPWRAYAVMLMWQRANDEAAQSRTVTHAKTSQAPPETREQTVCGSASLVDSIGLAGLRPARRLDRSVEKGGSDLA